MLTLAGATAPTRTGHRPARATAVLPLAVTLLFLAACTSDTPGPETLAPAATVEPTDTTQVPMNDPVQARNAAIAAYRGMWSAYQHVGETPDAAFTPLEQFATGDALKTLTSGLRSIRD